jgi:Zn-dependent protease
MSNTQNKSQQNKDSLLTLATAGATAAITYAIWRNPYVLIGASILVAHEYGHYYAAKESGAEVKTPVFAPAIITMLGGTYAKDIPDENKAEVALSGAKNGLIAAGLGILVSRVIGQYSMLAPLVGFSINEIVSGTIGSDGRKYRAAKNNK